MIELKANLRIVDQLAFGHDGQRLYAAGTCYGKYQLQRTNQGIDVWQFPGQANPDSRLLAGQWVKGLVVNPAGKWLYANADQYIRARGAFDSDYFAIDTATGQPTRLGLIPYTQQPAVHPSGDWIVGCGCIGDWSNTRIIRWRQPTNGPAQPEWELTPNSHDERPWRIAYDTKRSRLLSFEGGHQRDQGWVGRLVSRDPSNWVVQEQLSLGGELRGEIVLSPNGSCLVILSGPCFSVRDLDEFEREPKKVSNGKLHLTSIAFHPSGRYLAATSNDTTVKLYDTTTWTVAKTFSWNIGRMRSIAFSPDGTLAAAGSDTGKVVVWDVDL
jgi:WD40 repeat protein